MSPKKIILQEGAILISDAHYSFKHPGLLDLLRAIAEKKIFTSQLLLMGDMFDLLFSNVPFTLERNKDVIDLINLLSKQMEIIYLEGNHDFNLASLFPNLDVYPLSAQPVEAIFHDRRVGLAHGDFGGEIGYRIYTAVIRNSRVLKLLDMVDQIGNNFIMNALDNKLTNKDDCRKIDHFEQKIREHLKSIDLSRYDYFIEGHFHQDRQFDIAGCHYINPAAFACNETYYVVKSDQSGMRVDKVLFDRES